MGLNGLFAGLQLPDNIITCFSCCGFCYQAVYYSARLRARVFFKTQKQNNVCGTLLSVITFTPYHYWRKKHAIHHKSAGNLQHRGIGDVYTMTVKEYFQLSRWGKFKYRLYRNPLILFVVFPTILFLIVYRFPTPGVKNLRNYNLSVYITSLVIGAIIAFLILLVGWKVFLLVQLPISIITSSTGVWLFFVQHQFEDTYWASEENWDFSSAALHGSSFYKLPKVLQWFTGNIGFHHIHHLSPRIPNYLLEKCQKENPQFQETAKVLTLRTSLKSVLLTLWDENQKKLISFRQSKRLYFKMNKASV